MKKPTMIIIIVSLLVFIGLFFFFISYSSKTDISEDIRFKIYLNKPLIVKQPSALKQNFERSNRFSKYYIENSTEESFKVDKSILFEYRTGDTITFTSAKKYFSYHVGDSYYLLGKHKLKSGETIDFEYSASFTYSPAIWESLDEFLERRMLDNDFP